MAEPMREAAFRRDVIERLDRIERLVRAVVGDQGCEVCPGCGSGDLEDTAVMGEPDRLTCRECGNSWRTDGEAGQDAS